MKKIEFSQSPREVWQDIFPDISMQQKIEYTTSLLFVGLDYLDCISFAQQESFAEQNVFLSALQTVKNRSKSTTKVMAYVEDEQQVFLANQCKQIEMLRMDFSLLGQDSLAQRFEQIKKSAAGSILPKQSMVLYLGVDFSAATSGELLAFWLVKFSEIGICNFMLVDSLGMATPENTKELLAVFSSCNPKGKVWLSLGNNYASARDILEAALQNNCSGFGFSTKGLGSVLGAKPQKFGTLSGEKVINFLLAQKLPNALNLLHYESSYNQAKEIFGF